MKMSYRSIPIQRNSLHSSPNNTLSSNRQASQQQVYQHPVQDEYHNYSHHQHHPLPHPPPIPSRISHSADRQIFSTSAVNGNYYSLNDRGQSDETWRSGNYGTLPLGSTTSSKSEASSHTKRPFESAFRSAIERMRLSSESRLEGLGQDTHYPGCSSTSVFPPGIIPSSTSSAGSNYCRQNVRVSGYQEPLSNSSMCCKPPSSHHPVGSQSECVSPPPPPIPRQRYKYGSQTSPGTVIMRQTTRNNETDRMSSSLRRSSYDVPITNSGTQTEPWERKELAEEKNEKRSVMLSESTRDYHSRSNFASKYDPPSNVFQSDYRNIYESIQHPYETNERIKTKIVDVQKSSPSTHNPFTEVEYETPKRQSNPLQSYNNSSESYTKREEIRPTFTYPSPPPPPPIRRISHAKFSPRPQSIDERTITQRQVSSHQFVDKIRANTLNTSTRMNSKELKEFNPETEKEEKLELPSVKDIVQQVEAISRDSFGGKSSFEESQEVFPQRMTQSYYDDKSKSSQSPSSIQNKSATFRERQARVSEVLGRKNGDHQLSGDYQKLLDAFNEQKNEIEKLRRDVATRDTLISNLQINLRRYEPWH